MFREMTELILSLSSLSSLCHSFFYSFLQTCSYSLPSSFSYFLLLSLTHFFFLSLSLSLSWFSSFVHVSIISWTRNDHGTGSTVVFVTLASIRILSWSTQKVRVVWRFPTSKVTLRPYLHDSSSCNMETSKKRVSEAVWRLAQSTYPTFSLFLIPHSFLRSMTVFTTQYSITLLLYDLTILVSSSVCQPLSWFQKWDPVKCWHKNVPFSLLLSVCIFQIFGMGHRLKWSRTCWMIKSAMSVREQDVEESSLPSSVQMSLVSNITVNIVGQRSIQDRVENFTNLWSRKEQIGLELFPFDGVEDDMMDGIKHWTYRASNWYPPSWSITYLVMDKCGVGNL